MKLETVLSESFGERHEHSFCKIPFSFFLKIFFVKPLTDKCYYYWIPYWNEKYGGNIQRKISVVSNWNSLTIVFVGGICCDFFFFFFNLIYLILFFLNHINLWCGPFATLVISFLPALLSGGVVKKNYTSNHTVWTDSF